MKKRSLSEKFLATFKDGGVFSRITEISRYDPTLDFELRGSSVMIYYRGGKILEISENGTLDGLDAKYARNDLYTEDYPPLKLEEIESYFAKAKRLIDRYQIDVKNNLGEKEIQQRVVYENNLSVNAEDNDFFIADIEWSDNEQLGGRADIVAFRWNHMSHTNRRVQMTLIEVKQGESSIKSYKKRSKGDSQEEKDSAGLRKHYEDYLNFKKNPKYVSEVADDMLLVLYQKYLLGLVKGLENLFVDGKMPDIKPDVDFIFLLANYKPYSKLLQQEIATISKCKFFVSSFTGYCLYQGFILDKKTLIKNFSQVYGFKKMLEQT